MRIDVILMKREKKSVGVLLNEREKNISIRNQNISMVCAVGR